MLANPNASFPNRECYQWMESLVVKGAQVCVPEIADYEVRRELLRANKLQGIARLDILKNAVEYLPITTAIMLKAAELWAQARRVGLPTADPKALDCDVILAAQALAARGRTLFGNNRGLILKGLRARNDCKQYFCHG